MKIKPPLKVPHHAEIQFIYVDSDYRAPDEMERIPAIRKSKITVEKGKLFR